MCSFGICIFVSALLLPGVEARSFTSGSSHFRDAPPIADATLAIDALLLATTLVQLGIATLCLFRARSGHHLPGIGTVLALVLLAPGYALSGVVVVEAWTTKNSGGISLLALKNVQMATTFFRNCADAMIFAAVTLVLRDRHLTHVQSTKGTPGRAISLRPWTIVAYILFTALVLVAIVNVALLVEEFYIFYYENRDFATWPYFANDAFFAFIAIYSLATLYLIAFATVVKRFAKTDKITTLTLTIIMPLLTFLIIFYTIFEILSARLTQSASHTLETAQAFGLSSALLYGLLHLAVTAMLVYFLMIPGLWDGTNTGGYNMSQDGHASGDDQLKAPDRISHPYAHPPLTS